MTKITFIGHLSGLWCFCTFCCSRWSPLADLAVSLARRYLVVVCEHIISGIVAAKDRFAAPAAAEAEEFAAACAAEPGRHGARSSEAGTASAEGSYSVRGRTHMVSPEAQPGSSGPGTRASCELLPSFQDAPQAKGGANATAQVQLAPGSHRARDTVQPRSQVATCMQRPGRGGLVRAKQPQHCDEILDTLQVHCLLDAAEALPGCSIASTGLAGLSTGYRIRTVGGCNLSQRRLGGCCLCRCCCGSGRGSHARSCSRDNRRKAE